MGKNTSVYLSSDDLGRIERLGDPKPATVMRRGLDAMEADAGLKLTPAEVAQLESSLSQPGHRQPCPGGKHPRARIHKGLCMACGTSVGEP